QLSDDLVDGRKSPEPLLAQVSHLRLNQQVPTRWFLRLPCCLASRLRCSTPGAGFARASAGGRSGRGASPPSRESYWRRRNRRVSIRFASHRPVEAQLRGARGLALPSPRAYVSVRIRGFTWTDVWV